jgi:hypothetical protein
MANFSIDEIDICNMLVGIFSAKNIFSLNLDLGMPGDIFDTLDKAYKGIEFSTGAYNKIAERAGCTEMKMDGSRFVDVTRIFAIQIAHDANHAPIQSYSSRINPTVTSDSAATFTDSTVTSNSAAITNLTNANVFAGINHDLAWRIAVAMVKQIQKISDQKKTPPQHYV